MPCLRRVWKQGNSFTSILLVHTTTIITQVWSVPAALLLVERLQLSEWQCKGESCWYPNTNITSSGSRTNTLPQVAKLPPPSLLLVYYMDTVPIYLPTDYGPSKLQGSWWYNSPKYRKNNTSDLHQLCYLLHHYLL